MDDQDFWEWFKEHTQTEEELMDVLDRVEVHYLRILIEHRTITPRVSAAMVKWLEEDPHCACGHEKKLHGTSLREPKPDERPYLRSTLVPAECLMCKCMAFSQDNLDWLYKNSMDGEV